MIATLAGGGIALPGLAQLPAGGAMAGASVLPPVLILVLCVAAGIGTVLLLPARRQPGLHGIGAALLIAAGLILLATLVHWAAGPVGGAAGRAGMSVYFWIFAAIALVGAMRVVTHPRPVYSALYFVLTVFASAGLFVLLWAEFMAAALVLIYAGAILITYVFVIMLAAQARNPQSATIPAQVADYDAVSREPLLASAIGFVLMGVLLLVIFDRASELPPPPAPAVAAASENAGGILGSTQQLGVYLFSNQIVTLELAGLLLTVAMIGAVLIARRRVLHLEQHRSAIDVVAPMTPVSDDPHSIPVFGSDNPRQKEYPET
ncbi:MAG TPA: NADH-quinone oxidoreductase subunit J [Tepidisphaeraceae bacterium]|jgi:NADH-quinone oxidoreductase subunit J|nr:NADH-quinone oxidoreductase subunit J [Tepidisphaeraceae bacterium]